MHIEQYVHSGANYKGFKVKHAGYDRPESDQRDNTGYA